MTDGRPSLHPEHARRPNRVTRRHEATPHTADVGIRAHAPDLAGLFEEAARAVAEIGADALPDGPAATIGGPSNAGLHIDLEAADLPGLAFAWLNELIGLADIHGPLARTEVVAVEALSAGGWRLRGRAAFGGGARPRLDIKSATLHGLVVERAGDGWRLAAYLDV